MRLPDLSVRGFPENPSDARGLTKSVHIPYTIVRRVHIGRLTPDEYREIYSSVFLILIEFHIGSYL